MTKIIAITGGKGGTGKSTIATTLTRELANENKVLLIDADVDCPNDHLLLNIERKQLKSVNQRIPDFDLETCTKCGKCGKVCKSNAIISIKNHEPIFIQEQCNGCGACSIICPVNAISWKNKEIGKIYSGYKNNINLLSGELNPNQPVSEFIVNELNNEIELNKSKYDYVIIDTAAGTHCPVITAFEKADEIIAVTEPTPLGAHDLNVILNILKKLKRKCKVIINRSDIGDMNNIKDVVLKHNTDILFEIPFSKNIVNSYSNGKAIKIPNLISKIMDNKLKS